MGGGSTGLILPDEPVDVDKINSNMRIIDNLLGARNIPSASSYGGTMDGDLVYTQDTGYLHMYSASDTALINPRLPGARMYSGTRAQRIAFIPRAKEGDLWRDTDNIGALWALNGASPGVWEYSGNRMRGTKAAMNQMVTDGIVVAGMYATCTDDNSEYVWLSGAWVRNQVANASLVSASISASAWVPLTSASSWSFSPALQLPWNSGVVIPATGTYLLAVAAELVGTDLTHGRFVLKKNDTTGTNSGTILASQSRFDAGSVIVSAARQVPLVNGDVITPAAIAFGAAATLTPAMTGFSIQRVN